MDVSNEIPGWGVDLADDARPGVPMEHTPTPVGAAHWDQPPAQQGSPTVYKPATLFRMPAVFGTAQPPRGLSGLIRRAAYTIPQHKVRHWLMLMFADRVDVAEHNIARVARWLPLLVPAVAAGAWLARRSRRSRRWRVAALRF